MGLTDYINFWERDYHVYYLDRHAHAFDIEPYENWSNGRHDYNTGNGYTLRCLDINLIFNI